MQTKSKLLFIVALMLFALGIVTIINVSLNFRDYSLKSAQEKALMTAAIVKDGLTAHMVNGIMDKREYFLNQISHNNAEVKALWLVRSQKVIEQFGKGYNSETIRDTMDQQVLKTGKLIKKVHETAEKITLRISIPYIATVDGGTNCLQCHKVSRGDTLGAISMEFDITNMRNTGMLTILKILLINLFFVIIALLLINHYISPYMQLFITMQEGIKKAYKGDFTYKFSTTVEGDGAKIIEQLNTLFRKMQETFGDIKSNLATFIPQGCISTNDPLYEAKTIIGELSNIYKFKKTIELDQTKEIIYKRIVDVLTQKYELHSFEFYEIDTKQNKRTIFFSTNDTKACNENMEQDAFLCRAYRTKSDVISSDFMHLCTSCTHCNEEYICLPFIINDDAVLVLSINAHNKDELNKINNYIPSIKNYFEAAKPVIESKILTSKLRESSLKDAMTGLYNRRFLEEFIDKIMNQAKRSEETYGILMLDVDFFKDVNDTYGHDVGDKVIASIGTVLTNDIRESDLAIRYGGEEFLVLLHNATPEGILKVAQKIHKDFANLSFEIGDGTSIKKTISIGISKFPQDAQSIWKCIKYADTALYVAKTTGRNKVVEFDKNMIENESLR